MNTDYFNSRPRKIVHRKKGAVILATVIFTWIILMLMGSYLYLATSEYRTSSRSFLLGACFNLAEGGIDKAIDAINADDKNGWTTGIQQDGNSWWARTFNGFVIGSDIPGKINVLINDANTRDPTIYSEGVAISSSVGELKRQIMVKMTKPFFVDHSGFDSRLGFKLNGNNVSFDAYDSSLGPYGVGNQHAEVVVSTPSFEVDAILQGNADIYGYVATGGGLPDVGPQGSITTFDNPNIVDYTRVTTDHDFIFPTKPAPYLVNPITTFPPVVYAKTDLDYVALDSDAATLSSSTSTSTSTSHHLVPSGQYLVSDVAVNSGEVIDIVGDVTLVVTNTVNVQGEIRISDGGSLNVYVQGDWNTGGNGAVNNLNTPDKLYVVGTNTSDGAQTIKISGNGNLTGSLYAPQANIEFKGGGNGGHVFGAVVAYEAKLAGNVSFTYDMNLDTLPIGGDGMEITQWKEITDNTEKVDFASYVQ